MPGPSDPDPRFLPIQSALGIESSTWLDRSSEGDAVDGRRTDSSAQLPCTDALAGDREHRQFELKVDGYRAIALARRFA